MAFGPAPLPHLASLLQAYVASATQFIDGQSFTITGVGFGATQGTLSLGGANQTVTSWSSTEITGTFAQANFKYFTSYNLVVTPATGNGAAAQALATGVSLASDHTAVDLTSIETNSSYRITALPDLAIGDQLEARNVVGSDISDLVLHDDATFMVGASVTSFEVRAWDAGGQTWGGWALQSIVSIHTRARVGFGFGFGFGRAR